MVAKKRRSMPGVILLVTGVATLAMVGGFAIGTLTVGSFSSSPHQTGASNLAPSGPAGVSFPLAEATMVTLTSHPGVGDCVSSNLGTLSAPTPLTSGTNTTLCLSTPVAGFVEGDTVFILDIQWNSSAVVSTTFEVQVFLAVNPSSNDVLATSFVSTSATIASPEVAVFALDLTQSTDYAITGFNVLVTQR